MRRVKTLFFWFSVSFLGLFLSLILISCKGKTSEPSKNPDAGAILAPSEPEEVSPKDLSGLLFVSIGNNPQARPQTGLGQAALCFEAPAEGGITRIFAGFTKEVPKIGPVRSARKCLVQVAVGFNAPFAHCGGSEDSYQIIRREKTKSLDDIYTAGECFWRTDDRTPPDNLYTSTEKVVLGAKNRGFSLPQLPLEYGEATGGKDALVIEHNFSRLKGYPDLVSYTYREGSYLRSINGKPHKDSDERQISPANLVFIEVETSYPKGKAIEIDMKVEGEGKAIFFSRGKVFEGTWKKDSLHEPLEFLLDGKPFPFAQGTVWVHLVPDISLVRYKAENS